LWCRTIEYAYVTHHLYDRRSWEVYWAHR
jgi:hypothetical protein